MSAPLALDARRLVVVTGKGGVGKSTVAAALARAAQAAGRRVLAVDVDGSGVAAVLGRPEAGLDPQTVSAGLAVARIEPSTALTRVVQGMLPLPVLARRLLTSTSFQLIAAAAPGLPEYLTLTTIAGWVESTRLRRPRWDLVIVDAPASGHSLPLLTAPRTLGALARFGPIAGSLARIDTLLRDPERTALWLVTLPEELPVREAIELHAALTTEAGLPVATPIVNALPKRRFSEPEAARLAAPDLDPTHPMVIGARLQLDRRKAAQEQLVLLRRAIGVKPVRLPYQPAGPMHDELTTLARIVGQATRLAE